MDYEVVQVRMRLGILILAVFGTFLLVVCPMAVGVVVLVLAPWSVGVPVGLGGVGFGAVMAYLISSGYHWVEIDGSVIRGQKLLTRRIVERSLDDLVQVQPLHSKLMGDIENLVMDILMQTSNRGYALCFRDGEKIGLVRGDMAGLDDFMQGLRARLGPRWKHLTTSTSPAG